MSNMELLGFLILGLPLIFNAGISFLNGYSFFRLYRQIEEPTILHISGAFILVGVMFCFFTVPVILPTIPPLDSFLVANIAVWLIFLEIGNAYFTAFLNCSKVYERYSLPIFGGAIGFAIFTALNPSIHLIVDPITIEVVLFLASFISTIYLLLMAYRRLNVILGNFEDEELKLILFIQRFFWISAGLLVYTFVTVFIWLTIKGIDLLTININQWETLDFLVYFNAILYSAYLLGAFVFSRRIDYDRIDISSILNILDSPSSD
ncbi:MAG: hypothetical protein ACW97P_05815 [Candidatus Hodarchaeales archaeon]